MSKHVFSSHPNHGSAKRTVDSAVIDPFAGNKPPVATPPGAPGATKNVKGL